MDVAEFQGAIHAVVGKWKIEILRTSMGGPRSFGELRRSPSGISQHIATAPERARRAVGCGRARTRRCLSRTASCFAALGHSMWEPK